MSDRFSNKFIISIESTETIASMTKSKRFKFLKMLNNTSTIRSAGDKSIISYQV